MARRRDAARRVSQSAQDTPEQQDQAASGPQAGRVGRRRQQQPKAAASPAAASAAAFEDPVESMSSLIYYPWQYGGVLLGITACASTMVYYDQEDPWRVTKLLTWMFVALLGLAIHETRPFRRMNYGDRAREMGISVGSAFRF